MKFFQKSYGDPIRGRMRVVGMEWERELPCTSNTLMTKLNELAILSSNQQLGISKRDGRLEKVARLRYRGCRKSGSLWGITR